jgi:hypothetical protein
LVVISAVGFLTTADDLRHVGEVLGVASVLVVGLLMLVAGSTNSGSTRAAVWWLAGAVGAGAVIGAAGDNMPVGVGGGLTIGLLVAAVLGRRRERVRE